MEPQGRCNGHFEPKRQSGDDRADDEDHEDGGSVAAVLRAEIEIAMGAPIGDSQEAAKKSADATSRAPAAQSSRVGGKGWEGDCLTSLCWCWEMSFNCTTKTLKLNV